MERDGKSRFTFFVQGSEMNSVFLKVCLCVTLLLNPVVGASYCCAHQHFLETHSDHSHEKAFCGTAASCNWLPIASAQLLPQEAICGCQCGHSHSRDCVLAVPDAFCFMESCALILFLLLGTLCVWNAVRLEALSPGTTSRKSTFKGWFAALALRMGFRLHLLKKVLLV